MNVKGYKVFNSDWTCRGFQYEVGKTYEEAKDLKLCKIGFHFCERAVDCFNYYDFDAKNKVAEVIAHGDVVKDGDKSCTNKIEIVREISWQEVLTLVNTGVGCTGKGNSGDWNSGDRNSGDRNSGYRNSGDWNSGGRNSGDRNSGDRNSGEGNSGEGNSGDRNSGYRNSGYRNSGGWNSGDWNSGDRNSGYRNSGYRNSGDWNSGSFNKSNFNSGCFNTETHTIMMFDKPTNITMQDFCNSNAYLLLDDVDLTPARWVSSDDMTEQEKSEHKEHKTLGGYLKKRDISNAYIEWWSTLNEHKKGIIKSMPNFDADKFYEITGVRV